MAHTRSHSTYRRDEQKPQWWSWFGYLSLCCCAWLVCMIPVVILLYGMYSELTEHFTLFVNINQLRTSQQHFQPQQASSSTTLCTWGGAAVAAEEEERKWWFW